MYSCNGTYLIVGVLEGESMGKLKAVFFVLTVLSVSEWAYAPIRITPDEIDLEHVLYLSNVAVQKHVVVEKKKYILFTLMRERVAYKVGFNVHDLYGKKICALNGNMYDQERYAKCENYFVKINLQNYETRIGNKTYVSIDLYDRYKNVVGSKKVFVRS